MFIQLTLNENELKNLYPILRDSPETLDTLYYKVFALYKAKTMQSISHWGLFNAE